LVLTYCLCSALKLLSTDLLPGKAEEELVFLETLFRRNTPAAVEYTFDTDAFVQANGMMQAATEHKKPADDLLHAIDNIRAGAISAESFHPFSMTASAMVAASTALKRASDAGKLGKGGKDLLKKATQRTAGILAMRAASSSAITGAMDGVFGADPLVVETICKRLTTIFEGHGAVRLNSPLLRPRPNNPFEVASGGHTELLNTRGAVVILPEDLTAPFGKKLLRTSMRGFTHPFL
jgi:hypothetical protein